MTRTRKSKSAWRSKNPDAIHLKAAADRLIIAECAELVGPNVLVILLNGTTLATGLRNSRPELKYTFYTPEHFFLTTLKQFHPEDVDPSSSVRLICAADPPLEEFDSIAFPTSAIGSAEQTQEMLQIAHQRLRIGGRLVVSTNNPADKWLHERLRELFDKTTVKSQRDGVVYIAHKSSPLKKERDFRATFAFRLQEQLVFVESRPGVFSHRRVDGGARALIKSLEHSREFLEQSSGRTGRTLRIADLGCGSGAVSAAAAFVFPEARILAVDSHARAVECTSASAVRNEIDRIDVLLESDAVLPNANSWDLILTNPPYYSDFRISELFLHAAFSALRPGGRIHLVTKLLDWHLSRMNQLFRDVEVHRIGEYDVIIGGKR